MKVPTRPIRKTSTCQTLLPLPAPAALIRLLMKLSRRALRWALEGLVVQHVTVARVAEALHVAWNAANDAVLAEGQRALIGDPGRFAGVAVIGVDEHVWRHTSKGDKYVTVIIDLTAVRAGTGPARLLDMVEGRSKQASKSWIEARPKQWRDGIEVVAMDGFTGFKTATTEELPAAVPVMDPFHVGVPSDVACVAGEVRGRGWGARGPVASAGVVSASDARGGRGHACLVFVRKIPGYARDHGGRGPVPERRGGACWHA